jgi:hypothetical protein
VQSALYTPIRSGDKPPLAVLLDLQTSCLKVLVRLGDIQVGFSRCECSSHCCPS